MRVLFALLALVLIAGGAYLMGQAYGVKRMQYAVDTYAAANATLTAALDVQNESITALGQESARRLARTSANLRDAQREAREAQTLAGRLMRPLKGTDECERLREVDARLMEALGA